MPSPVNVIYSCTVPAVSRRLSPSSPSAKGEASTSFTSVLPAAVMAPWRPGKGGLEKPSPIYGEG